MTCDLKHCDRPTTGRKPMCVMHWARWCSHGDTSPPSIRLLVGKIEFSEDGCWEWQAHRDPRGYGRFVSKQFPSSLAHRSVYEAYVGPIPDGLELDHLCRNPGCVNPKHLEPVTHAENVRRGTAGWSHDGRCIHGHDLTDPANVYQHARGSKGRKCKTCALRRAREAHERKKEHKQ